MTLHPSPYQAGLVDIISDKYVYMIVDTSNGIWNVPVLTKHATNISMHTWKVCCRYPRIAVFNCKHDMQINL